MALWERKAQAEREAAERQKQRTYRKEMLQLGGAILLGYILYCLLCFL